MPDMEPINQMELYRVSGVIASARSTTDKALLIEKEIGTEPLYAMIAMGLPESRIATDLGLSKFELSMILRRTPAHRKQYINAKAVSLAEDSMEALQFYSKMVGMDIEESSGARHHLSVFNTAMKAVNSVADDKGTGNVVVNNTVVVRQKEDVPELPDGLDDIIEGEYSVSSERQEG